MEKKLKLYSMTFHEFMKQNRIQNVWRIITN